MVLEDYGELMFLQTVLKKLGFDVDSIQNPRAFGDSILRMNPDILVMTAQGKRVNGVELSRGIRRLRGLPRVILLRSQGGHEDSEAVADGWVESPVAALTLLNLIADLCGLNKQVLADKFQKLQMREIEEEKERTLKTQENTEPTLNVNETPSGNFGVLQSSTIPSPERLERYKKFLEEPPPTEHSFASRTVIDHVRSLRSQENSEELADLERERKAFVEHLFKKKG